MISRVAYVVPLSTFKKAEKDKINVIIRKADKQALGVPTTASNEPFEAMGTHDTLEEIVEAQQIAQFERLVGSVTGRYLLQKLNIK